MNKRKVIILTSIIIGVLVLTLGLTYAAVTYNETKGNSKLVLGDIYMHYNESDTSINITNLMPNENYTNDYFEFTIDGKNTYNQEDIYYEIVLNDGEYVGDDLNRTVPIDSQLLKFKLVEVNNNTETEIFSDRTYSDITNKRIHVDTIGASDGNYSKTYRLYVRIAEYLNICGGDASDNCDYYLNPSEENQSLDWNKVYASIKVNVSGDFEEKSIETDGSCFTYEISDIENPTVNPVMQEQTKEKLNELTACILNYNVSEFDEGSDAESFCKGTGTSYGLTIQEDLAVWSTADEYFLQNGGQNLLDTGVIISNGDGSYTVNSIMQEQEVVNELTSCVTFFGVLGSDSAEDFCKGTGTANGYTFQELLNSDDGFLIQDIRMLLSLNIITGTPIADLVTYDASCGPDVVIPREIDGNKIVQLRLHRSSYADSLFTDTGVKNIILLDNITQINDYELARFGLENIEIPDSVTYIGYSAFYMNNLKSVKLPPNLELIESSAFDGNKLTKIEIPNSVTIIESGAFQENNLKSIVFQENSKLQTIGEYAFRSNQLVSVEIPNSVITMEYAAFSHNNLKSIVFQENSKLQTIGFDAFANNQLVSVEIPNSVTTINSAAFSYNNLETVTIGSGIQTIHNNAFNKSISSNPNLQSIVFTSKTCEEIKNMLYFPWLEFSSPYYQEGYKANIIGTDGVCNY